MRGADLSNADMMGPGLGTTNLNRADLSGADLSGAQMGTSTFHNTNFSGANLTGAQIFVNEFYGTNFRNANLEQVTIRGPIKMVDVNLAGANLMLQGIKNILPTEVGRGGLHLINVNLRGTDLRGLDMSRVSLKNVVYDADTRWPAGFTPPTETTVYDPD